MKQYFVKTPTILQQLFRSFVWRFSTNRKEIYLTFDDGPTPKITNWVVSELEKYNAKATFFCVGKNIILYPETYNNIIANNHAIGNHTYHHHNGFKTNVKSYIESIMSTQQLLDNSIKENSMLFRPPYGKIKRKQAKKLQKLGYKIIMWDVLSADFDSSISNERCLKNVLKNAKSGSVVVFHDSVKAYDKLHYTLPKVLDYFSKKGYVFKAIS